MPLEYNVLTVANCTNNLVQYNIVFLLKAYRTYYVVMQVSWIPSKTNGIVYYIDCLLKHCETRKNIMCIIRVINNNSICTQDYLYTSCEAVKASLTASFSRLLTKKLLIDVGKVVLPLHISNTFSCSTSLKWLIKMNLAHTFLWNSNMHSF